MSAQTAYRGLLHERMDTLAEISSGGQYSAGEVDYEAATTAVAVGQKQPTTTTEKTDSDNPNKQEHQRNQTPFFINKTTNLFIAFKNTSLKRKRR